MDFGARALADYTLAAKYATIRNGLRETYPQAVERVIEQHRTKFRHVLGNDPRLSEYLLVAEQALLEKRALGSQRVMQFGGLPVLRKNARSYNCCASYCDRVEFFQEALWLLLCGCGVGFSVQKHHVAQLPPLPPALLKETSFVVPDSIEGWAQALGHLVSGAFSGRSVSFDYSAIRPKGSAISSGAGVAPGPEPLRRAIEACRAVIYRRVGQKLRPIDCYDVVMHASCAVLSGGVRRSATIALFSPEDEEMLTAKSGNWTEANPQRARSNNSAMLLRGRTPYEDFLRFVRIAEEGGGEPGFVWVDSLEFSFNPCLEVGFLPSKGGRSGWQFCNLSTVNGARVRSEEDFYDAAEAAATLGTLQAAYTSFPFLGPLSEEITRHEALLGVSITGVQDAPDILLDPRVLREGAQRVRRRNAEVAKAIGIRPAARATAIKPEGTTSCLVGSASGKGRHHASRYIRRVQANASEVIALAFARANPESVEDSVWNPGDIVLKFPIQAPPGSRLRADETAQDQLKDVLTLKRNWVDAGKTPHRSVHPDLSNNVSNTVTVRAGEWEEVAQFIFRHQGSFAGVSLLAASGDTDYPQAPFVSVDEEDRADLREEWHRLRGSLQQVDYSGVVSDVSFSEVSACAGGSCDV